jgi:hypothetical protein
MVAQVVDSVLHFEFEVLDATGEFGDRPGRISLDEIVGAEILVEGAVAIALANKLARIAWPVLTCARNYQPVSLPRVA